MGAGKSWHWWHCPFLSPKTLGEQLCACGEAARPGSSAPRLEMRLGGGACVCVIPGGSPSGSHLPTHQGPGCHQHEGNLSCTVLRSAAGCELHVSLPSWVLAETFLQLFGLPHPLLASSNPGGPSGNAELSPTVALGGLQCPPDVSTLSTWVPPPFLGPAHTVTKRKIEAVCAMGGVFQPQGKRPCRLLL